MSSHPSSPSLSLRERLASVRALVVEREEVCLATRALLLRAEDLLADALQAQRELELALHGRMLPEIPETPSPPRPPAVAEAVSDA